MGLETTGIVSVAVNRAAAFDFVADPARLAKCIPGCTDLRELAAGRYSAELTSKVAYITLKFRIISEIVKVEPPNLIEAKLSGDSIGLAGRLAATASLQLSEVGETYTDIRYVADVVLTGKLGGLGQPVFRAKSLELAREFEDNLKAALEKGRRSPPA